MRRNNYHNKIPPFTPDPEHFTRMQRLWKAKVVKIRTCRVSGVTIKRGANSFDYTDSTGFHVITSLAPIEIVNIVKEK